MADDSVFGVWSLLSLLVLSSAFNGTLLQDGKMATTLEQGISSSGGSTILVEEYTATWCAICREVDPLIPTLLEPNQERIAFVSLHPADGIDTLGNGASATRLSWYLSEDRGSPTFIFDGAQQSVGAVSMSQLHADLLSAESARPLFSDLELSIARVDAVLQLELELDEMLAENELLTILIVEDGVAAEGENGEQLRLDHVLRAMLTLTNYNGVADPQVLPNTLTSERIEYDLNAERSSLTVDIAIASEWDLNSLGFIGVHEANSSAGRQVYGAVQIVARPSAEAASSLPWLVAAGGLIGIGIIVAAGGMAKKPSKRFDSDE